MKQIQVRYQGHGETWVLGQLAADGQRTLFEYSPEALARGLELSPINLPLRALAYPTRQGEYADLYGLPGLIYDSLPDGWGLRLMDRALHALGREPDSLGVLDKLAWPGNRALGALTFEPADAVPLARADLDLLQLATEARAIQQDDAHSILPAMLIAGGSPGGARPKVLVGYDPSSGAMSTRPSAAGALQPWLVKFPAMGDDTDSCALEAAYADLARACGIEMMPTQYFSLDHGLSAFATQRFDRNALGQRVPVHSLAGLLHVYFRAPSIGYSDFFRATRMLSRDQREVASAVQRCVFNVLMHNQDDHAKNFAFVLTATGQWRLSPAYDLTWNSGRNGQHFMDIAGEGKNVTRAHLISAAQTAGIVPRQTERMIDQMLDVLTPGFVRSAASAYPVGSRALKRVIETLETARPLLLG